MSTISNGRFALIALAGPLAGTLAYLGAMLVLDPPTDFVGDFLPVAGLVMFLGWPVGAIPALLAAIVWRWLRVSGNRWRRTAMAALVGAAAALLGTGAAIVLLGLRFPPAPVYLIITVCGAMAMVATAIPFSTVQED